MTDTQHPEDVMREWFNDEHTPLYVRDALASLTTRLEQAEEENRELRTELNRWHHFRDKFKFIRAIEVGPR